MLQFKCIMIYMKSVCCFFCFCQVLKEISAGSITGAASSSFDGLLWWQIARSCPYESPTPCLVSNALYSQYNYYSLPDLHLTESGSGKYFFCHQGCGDYYVIQSNIWFTRWINRQLNMKGHKICLLKKDLWIQCTYMYLWSKLMRLSEWSFSFDSDSGECTQSVNCYLKMSCMKCLAACFQWNPVNNRNWNRIWCVFVPV